MRQTPRSFPEDHAMQLCAASSPANALLDLESSEDLGKYAHSRVYNGQTDSAAAVRASTTARSLLRTYLVPNRA